MPVVITYPGVYIEEPSRDAHTISGVSTANTAFVDFFPRGPVDEPVQLASFGDFTHLFGGIHPWSNASYGIQQFFLNGGTIAWVVRIAVPGAQAATAHLNDGAGNNVLTVMAANSGAWGNTLRLAVLATTDPARFTLLVREVDANDDTSTIREELHRDLSMADGDDRNVARVLATDSALVRAIVTGTTPPAGEVPDDAGSAPASASATLTTLSGGADGNFRDTLGALLDQNALVDTLAGNGAATERHGIYALEQIAPDIFNILCLPLAADLDAKPAEGSPYNTLYAAATKFCEQQRAFLLIDLPADIDTQAKMIQWIGENDALRSANSAVHFPRVAVSDPHNGGQPRTIGNSGTLAGVYAATDTMRGVWKAPAGITASLQGAEPVATLNDAENGDLNVLGVNVLRTFPLYGTVNWGARTLRGADTLDDEYRYVPVRRLALYIEESLIDGLRWVVFEPNDEPTWAQIRLTVDTFMRTFFAQGAFRGSKSDEAYFVKCDRTTTTQAEINQGVVNILVGFAPLQPTEFVSLTIQQRAGQVQANS